MKLNKNELLSIYFNECQPKMSQSKRLNPVTRYSFYWMAFALMGFLYLLERMR